MTPDNPQAEPAYQEKDSFRFLVENVQDYAILTLDPQGQVATWNVGAERIFGYPENEILGKDFGTFFTPEDIAAERPRKELEQAAADGRAMDEAWHVRKDGTRFWASGVTHPLRNHSLVGFVKIVRDLTERKQAEDRLREEQQIAETLNRIGGVLAAELDLQKLLQTVTDEATKLTRAQYGAFFYNQVNQDGESYTLFTLSGAPRDALEHFPMPRNTALFGPTFRGEGVLRFADVTTDPRYGRNAPHAGMPDGHLPVRSYLAVPVSRSAEVLGGIFFGHPEVGVFTERDERIVAGIASQAAIAIDNARLFQKAQTLSEELRRHNEELAATDQRKNEFLAMLGHELRNPLAPLANALHILRQEQNLSPIVYQATNMAERQMRNLTRLVDDLLDVARITRGTIQLHRERIELAEIITRAVESVHSYMEACGHHLVVTHPRETIWMDGDAIRLQQVIVNLLNNSAKYTPYGGQIFLTMTWEGTTALLRVKDNGVGIAPDLLPKVFDLFTQAQRSLARSEGGLGIGLTMVRKLVEMHGGTVEAQSAGPGQGSEFTVRLPIHEVVKPVAHPARHPHARQLRQLRVLVVDDNVDAAQSLAMILRSSGHKVVDVIYNGPEALQVILTKKPDVVLLDIGLPGMDGYEIAERVRERPELKDMRLIAITGYGLETDRQRSRDVGIECHLVKPVDPAELQAVLAHTETNNV